MHLMHRIWFGLVVVATLSACFGSSGGGGALVDGGDEGDGGTTPVEKALELGPSTMLGSKTIGAEGGELVVSDGALAGLRITVPAGAYAESHDFKLAQAPITKLHSSIASLTVLSALLEVTTNAGLARELMRVTVPVTLQKGHVVMGFFYDRETGRFEGMPSYPSADGKSVVVVTRHFSDFTILDVLEEFLLAEPADTGFVHGVDDFAFKNEGSFEAPYGMCTGQTLAVLYHFLDRSSPMGKTLASVADNPDHPDRPTPTFPQDDARSIHLATAIQTELDFSREDARFFDQLKQDLKPHLSLQLLMFGLLMTNEPQFVGVYRPDPQSSSSIGHALLAYQKDAAGDTKRLPSTAKAVTDPVVFSISDPNYPKTAKAPKPRALVYDLTADKWVSYTGAERAGDPARVYPTVMYYGGFALVGEEDVASFWDQFDHDTLDGYHPDYQLEAMSTGDAGNPTTPLVDHLVRTDPLLRAHLVAPVPYTYRITAFDEHGKQVSQSQDLLQYVEVDLVPGDNLIGFLVEGIPADVEAEEVFPIPRYIDFRWLHVRYEAAPVGDAKLLGITNLDTAAVGVDVSGNTAWVGLLTPGIATVDVSDPANPRPIQSRTLDSFSEATGVKVDPRGYVMVGAGTFFLLDDNEKNPSVYSESPIGGFCGRMDTSADYAFMACNRLNTGQGFVGIADLAKPTEIDLDHGVTGISYDGNPRDVVLLDDGYLLAVNAGGALDVFDVSDETMPGQQPVASIDGEIGAQSAVRVGSLVYVAGPALRIIDVGDPTAPVVVGEEPFGSFVDLDILGSKVIAIGSHADGGTAVTMIDVSDPTTPVIIGTGLRIPDGNPRAVRVVGTHAYVALAKTDGKGALAVLGF